MNTHKKPRELCLDLLPRSTCNIKVSAVISDNHGIFAWGWNNSGTGLGMCAERHAILRANKNRLRGSTISIMGRWRKGNYTTSYPCPNCQLLISKYHLKVEYHTKDGWRRG